jgi:hypothetical protein
MIVNSPTAKDGIFPLNSNDLHISGSFKEIKNFSQTEAENKKREVHSKQLQDAIQLMEDKR